MFLAIEICLTGIFLALAYTYAPNWDRLSGPLLRAFIWLADRKSTAVAAVGLAAIAIRLALLRVLPVPAPGIHDEFSHLLLADTLAHGRLANPTHPMWVHFETFHVNWHPAYASMYFPGEALFLAFGQTVLGHPFWGVVLSCGLMCGAICWALQGWMPEKWALCGGVLAVFRLGTLSYWADSYWGGAVAALGGALVLGAFPRIRKTAAIRDALFLGAGMVFVALTRPFEGIFLCVPIVIGLATWAFRQDTYSAKLLLRRVAVPAGLTLTVGVAWLGFYFFRVTGSPFTTPYRVNIRTYGLIYFPWERITPVAPFHHLMMERFYRTVTLLRDYNFAHRHPLELLAAKMFVVWLFYFGPLLTVPWLAWLILRRKRRLWSSVTPEVRFLLILCAAAYLPGMLTIYVGQPHYVAPFAAAFYAATILVMRDLNRTASGRCLVRSVAIMATVLFVSVTVADIFRSGPNPSLVRTWCTPQVQNLTRARVVVELERIPGKHLVIVRYRPDHDFAGDEWVYNGADIDTSKVVFARDMGSDNRELIDYFKGRQVWFAEPDEGSSKLLPYRPGPESSGM